MIIYFENLTVELDVFYVLNIYIKFHINQIIFIIRSINLIFMSNFRLQKFGI